MNNWETISVCAIILLHPVKLSLHSLPPLNSLMQNRPVSETNRWSHRQTKQTEGSQPSPQNQCSLMANLCKRKGKAARHYRQSVWFNCFCKPRNFPPSCAVIRPCLIHRHYCNIVRKEPRESRPVVVVCRQLWYTDGHILACQDRPQLNSQQNQHINCPSVRPNVVPISTERHETFW